MVARDTPVLRFDVTTDDWVLFAPAPARRPQEHRRDAIRAKAPGPCPFCPGNEHLAPDEVLRVPGEHGRGWRVRVVRNKFPALEPRAAPAQRASGRVFREMDGYGVHEVVIESPEHDRNLADQPVDQIERVLWALHTRFVSLREDSRLRAIVVFKNQGERAGTSLMHPHWQIIATPVLPRLLRLKHEVAAQYFERTGACLYVATLEDELVAAERILATNEAFVALLPYASYVPYQVRILPRTPAASFARLVPPLRRPLALLLKDVLTRIGRALDNPEFNLIVSTAPLGDDSARFVWHVDLLPRLTTPAGFELGSGMAINPVFPEEAAARLRAVAPTEGAPG